VTDPARERAKESTPSSLSEAVARLQALRAEHRELAATIASDPGMAPETRQALLTHLRDEEDERISTVARLTGAARPDAAAPSPRGGLTVGSLRTPNA